MRSKLIALFIALLCLSPSVEAGRFRQTGFSYLLGATDSAILTSAGTRFYVPNGPEVSDASGTETAREAIWPTAVTVSEMVVYLSADIGAAGPSLTVTLRKNGADSLLSCAIVGSTANDVRCEDIGHRIQFAAGDRMSLQFVTAGTPTGVLPRWRIRVDPDVSSDYAIQGTTGNVSSNSDRFCGPNACLTLGTTDVLFGVVAAPGTVRALWARSGTAISSGTRVVTLVKNGAPDSTFAVSLLSGTQQASDVDGAVHFAVGDTISVRIGSADAATLTIPVDWAVRYVPDEIGSFPLFANSTPSTSAVNYVPVPAGTAAVASATQTDVNGRMPPLVLTRLYAVAAAAPANGSATWRFNAFRSDVVATPMDCLMLTAATSCVSNEQIGLEHGETLSIRVTPAGTPTSARIAFGLAARPR